MQIELTDQDAQIIRQALNSAPVTGAAAMIAVLRLMERLSPKAPATVDAPEQMR